MSAILAAVKTGDTSVDALKAKKALNGGNVYHIDTLKGSHPNDIFGHGAVAATIEMKRRLGYAPKNIGPTYGPTLDAYLHGRKHLPAANQARRAAAAAAVITGKQNLVLRIAGNQVGIAETGDNHTKFGVAYGMDGVPWCDEFVSWVLTQAGITFHYAYVPATVADARAGKNGLSIVKPQRCALACYDWQDDGTADHIGIVVKVYPNGTIDTIEGNTSDADFSNGGMVLRRNRSISLVQAFVGVKGLTK